ncbi:hypothetical protein OUZ56_007858 [Daphnia magna]|uniref:Uncharacterized protein n=1 Tax=Daphnia magna TaxID=35525 RepID=A0ABR0ABJ1_9CRUS|nr:hypothetical protein OUZ56_007858 [Daphnia magna]
MTWGDCTSTAEIAMPETTATARASMEPSTYRQQDANAEIRPLFEIRKGYYMKKGHKNVISIATLERQRWFVRVSSDNRWVTYVLTSLWFTLITIPFAMY